MKHYSLAVLARRPGLWGEALSTLLAMAPPGWWLRIPLRLAPEPEYEAWRRRTAYGSDDVAMRPEDLVTFLEWRSDFRGSMGN